MLSPYCPYTAGAEFVLLLNPSPSRPTSVPTSILRVKVLHVFPFTRSQTLKVAILAKSSAIEDEIPPIAVLKLYDHRYLEDRAPGRRRLWNQEKEDAAQNIALKIEACVNNLDYQGLSEDEIVQDLVSKDPTLTAGLQQWQIETMYQRRTSTWWEDECLSYHRLRTLQGVCIPKFYGSTEFDESVPMPRGIHPKVRGILLEFIDGTTLEEVDNQSPLALNHQNIGDAVVNCLERIARLGVMHGDVRLANVIIRRDGRVFLLDFAYAAIRPDGIRDEEWDKRVEERDEVPFMKLLLDEKKLRDRTPPSPYPDGRGDYSRFNCLIDRARESWRDKYYEPATLDSGYYIQEDDEGNTVTFFFPQWRLKEEEVKARQERINQSGSAMHLGISTR
jgi:serine/threonine protein kinase